MFDKWHENCREQEFIVLNVFTKHRSWAFEAKLNWNATIIWLHTKLTFHNFHSMRCKIMLTLYRIRLNLNFSNKLPKVMHRVGIDGTAHLAFVYFCVINSNWNSVFVFFVLIRVYHIACMRVRVCVHVKIMTETK